MAQEHYLFRTIAVVNLSLLSLVIWSEVARADCDQELLGQTRAKVQIGIANRFGLGKTEAQFELKVEDLSSPSIIAKEMYLIGSSELSQMAFMWDIPTEVAFARYLIKNKTLRFDIKVEEPFQELGMYRYMMAHVLKEHPQIKFIGSQIPWVSQNTQIFYKNFFTETDLSEKDFYVPKTTKLFLRRGREIRRAGLSALEKMPGYRVRKSLGFGRITKVVLDFDFTNDFNFVGGVEVDSHRPFALRFVVAKEGSADHQEVDFFVALPDRMGNYKISPEGKFIAVSEAEIEDMGDYVMPVKESRHFATESAPREQTMLGFPWQI